MYAAGRDVALDLLAPDPLAPDPPALDPLAGALSIAVFALVVLNGLDGSQTPSALLVPTAGYLLAHYVSLQVTQGQATAYLISDPMETGREHLRNGILVVMVTFTCLGLWLLSAVNT